MDKRQELLKNCFRKMSIGRFFAYIEVFGADMVYDELCKSANNKGHTFTKESVQKFMEGSTSDTNQSVSQENKETFNGTKYDNLPEGDVKTITEDPAPSVAKWDRQIGIAKTDVIKRIIIGAVYIPYDENDDSTIDSHGHAALAEDIEKAAYGFMKDMNNYNIDEQHNFVSGYGYVVESYLAKSGDPLFPEGTWVMGVKVTEDDTWSKIEKGEITGFSLAGKAHLRTPEELGI